LKLLTRKIVSSNTRHCERSEAKRNEVEESR
jgi:hypothetical protein